MASSTNPEYQVTLQPRPKRYLARLPKGAGDRLALAIQRLAHNPRPAGCLKLSGYGDVYRIRVGQYRVIYQVRDKQLLVLVIRVARRDERTYDL